jgi:hypothetical protein
MYIKFWSENLKGSDHSEDLGVDGKIILEWILGKLGGKMWTGCIWLRIGTSGGMFGYGNEPSSYMKGGEFLPQYWNSDAGNYVPLAHF